jgi:Flavin containing amine oxidoreductase
MTIRRRDLLKVVGSTVAASAATKLTMRSASAAQGGTIVRDVCILGGGSAGTYTAVRLGDFGKSVVVLEKKDRLGGHAETVTDPVTGIPVDIGVVVFEENPLVTGYFGRLDVPLVSVPLGGGGVTTYVDFRTGELVPSYAPPSDAAFGAALGEYLGLLEGTFPYLDSGFNLPNPVPEDLLAPFATFVQKYGLGALVDNAYLFAEGVGNLLDDPALYILKNFSLNVAGAIATGGFLAVPGGTSTLYDKAEQYLGGNNIVFNSEVLRVTRSGRGGIEVDVLTPDGVVRVKCQKLVVACPPTPTNLAPFDLDFFEADTLGRFKANYYATALVRLSGLEPGRTVQNVAANTPYDLAPLPGIYSLAPTEAPGLWNVKYGNSFWLPDDLVKASIIADIERMAARGSVPVKFEEYVAFSSHAPFEMMVSSQEIAAGFYTNLNALQGRNDTYYTSAAFQTNDSSLIWQFTEGLLPQIGA